MLPMCQLKVKVTVILFAVIYTVFIKKLNLLQTLILNSILLVDLLFLCTQTLTAHLYSYKCMQLTS